MPRPINPNVTRRNCALLDAYQLNPRQTYEDIGRKFGVSTTTVYLVLRAGGAISQTNRKERVPLAAQRPLSNLHALLGLELSRFLRENRSDESVTEEGLSMKMSAVRLGAAKRGLADFTLSELLMISDVLGTSLPELITMVFEKVGSMARSAHPINSARKMNN